MMLSSSPQPQLLIDEQERHLRTDEKTPLVSVIIPAYNVAQYIPETLASVFAQSLKDFEVIVINDGSPDSQELDRALQPYLNRIIYIKQQNRGPASARNTGIRNARGSFIALLDADDVWLPDYLTQQLHALEADSTLDLIYADALLDEGMPRGKSFMDIFPSRGPANLEALLEQRCVVITSCVVARRQALLDAGLFDESYLRSEDFDLWVRLAHRGNRLSYQRKVLAHHRVRPDSLAADLQLMQQSAMKVYENLMGKLELTTWERGLIERQITKYQFELTFARGKRELAAGEYGSAAALLKRACLLQRGLSWRNLNLRIARFGLLVAPRLTRQLYLRRCVPRAAAPLPLPSPTVAESKSNAQLTI